MNLTRREREIAELIHQGYTNKEIAKHLHLSVHTITNHITHMKEKFEVHSKTELVAKLDDELQKSKCLFCLKGFKEFISNLLKGLA